MTRLEELAAAREESLLVAALLERTEAQAEGLAAEVERWRAHLRDVRARLELLEEDAWREG